MGGSVGAAAATASSSTISAAAKLDDVLSVQTLSTVANNTLFPTHVQCHVSDVQQVREQDGSVRADAAVAAGNAFSSAAELAPSAQAAGRLLAAACEAYEVALRAEADAMTHSNLADALVCEFSNLQI